MTTECKFKVFVNWLTMQRAAIKPMPCRSALVIALSSIDMEIDTIYKAMAARDDFVDFGANYRDSKRIITLERQKLRVREDYNDEMKEHFEALGQFTAVAFAAVKKL